MENGETEKLKTVLYYTAQALEKISALLHPVMPERMTTLRLALGLDETAAANVEMTDALTENNILSGTSFL